MEMTLSLETGRIVGFGCGIPANEAELFAVTLLIATPSLAVG